LGNSGVIPIEETSLFFGFLLFWEVFKHLFFFNLSLKENIVMSITIVPASRFLGIVCLVMSVSLLSGCSKQDTVTPPVTPNPGGGNPPIVSPIPKTPPAIAYPADNKPLDINAEIELGRHLFFDKQMSVDGSTSCASCHQPHNGFSDVFPVSTGMQGQHGTRNAPTLTNVAFNSAFTWDGKFPSLEKHAPGPMFNSLEMGNNFTNGQDSSGADTVSNGYNSKPGNNDTLFLFARLDGNQNSRVVHQADPYSKRTDVNGSNYYGLLMAAWGDPTFSLDHIAKSIAAYERTFVSTSTPFDRYNAGDQTAMNSYALHGFQLFIDQSGANCVSCHSGYNFTDQQFHNNGGAAPSTTDIGRASITKQDSDKYKFKTPTLRNVSLTKPYFHNGSVDASSATQALNAVVSNYNKGGVHSANQDTRIKPLNLSDQDVSDIVEFLNELKDSGFGYDQRSMSPWGN